MFQMPYKKCSFCIVSSYNSKTTIFKCPLRMKALLGVAEKEYDEFHYICARHFSKSDIVGGEKRRRLKRLAIPCLFPHLDGETSSTHEEEEGNQMVEEDEDGLMDEDDSDATFYSSQMASQSSRVSSEWCPPGKTSSEYSDTGELISKLIIKPFLITLDSSFPYSQLLSLLSFSDSEEEEKPKRIFMIEEEALMQLMKKCGFEDCSSPCIVDIATKGASLYCRRFLLD